MTRDRIETAVWVVIAALFILIAFSGCDRLRDMEYRIGCTLSAGCEEGR